MAGSLAAEPEDDIFGRDLLDFCLFSLHLAAPKTTQLLLP